MYLITIMNWSDISMGDGNPQTQVALRETLEDAHQMIIAKVNDEWAPDKEISTFDQAVEYLRDATESPELDIREVQVGGEFQYLSRDVLDSSPRAFNGRHMEASWELRLKRKVLDEAAVILRTTSPSKLQSTDNTAVEGLTNVIRNELSRGLDRLVLTELAR